MAKSRLLRHLKKDEEDEDEGIKTYGDRSEELDEEDEPEMSNKIDEIQEEEKEHKSTIHSMRGKMKKGIGHSDPNWIKKAIKHPGALTSSAHKAGMSTHSFAEKHKHSKGKVGSRSRLALTLSKMHHKRK